MGRAEDHSLKVLMMPWVAHGHISPFLELAKRLTKKNIFIYFCSTQINLQSVTKRLENYSNSFQLVELHLPSLPELPPHLHTTNGLPLHLGPTLADAYQRSLPNMSAILEKLNPDIVLHDIMHPWVGELASSLNIPAIDFHIASAAQVCFCLHMIYKPGVEYPVPGIYLHDFENTLDVASIREGLGKNVHLPIGSPNKTCCNITLMRSYRELEGETIDYYSVLTNKKFLQVGPAVHIDKSSSSDNSKIIKWLNEKDKCSSVFVSFGSECLLSKEEIDEIAYGLELSEVNFIWNVRFPKEEEGTEKIRVEEKLPKGFLKRVGERGMVLEGWAPQLEILSHESVGGFVSHCGWSSIMESMKLGVPIIALPIQYDQPLNARVICQYGVAIEATKDKNGRIQKEEVAKAIRRVVIDKSGEDVRRKTKEFCEKLMSEGEEDIDVLVQEFSRICEEKKKSYTDI